MKEVRLPAEIVDQGTAAMVAELKKQGFRFESETCPISFSGHAYTEAMPDGSAKFFQWFDA